HFGRSGSHYYSISRGIDHRLGLANRVRKSIGAENTFPRDLTSLEDMRAELEPLVEKVWRYCEPTGGRGRAVTLKVKYADFKIITRSWSLTAPVADKAVLAAVTRELLATLHPIPKGVRLLGVSLSSLSCDQTDDPQMILAL